MNKLRSFQANYLEDALLVTLVIIIVLGLYLAAAYLLLERAVRLNAPSSRVSVSAGQPFIMLI